MAIQLIVAKVNPELDLNLTLELALNLSVQSQLAKYYI